MGLNKIFAPLQMRSVLHAGVQNSRTLKWIMWEAGWEMNRV